MRLIALAIVAACLGGGCQSSAPVARSGADAAMFGPEAMRIHPIFTQVKDWTGDGEADGIEVLIEFQDTFGDPTKALGRAIFELYEYRRDKPDPRGVRLANPWIGSLQTVDEQRQRWNRASRTYSFQLSYPEIESSSYVLTAIFELSSGGRYFDRIIVTPQERKVAAPPATLPATAASTQPATRSFGP